jgi:dephospho-CoA kinase
VRNSETCLPIVAFASRRLRSPIEWGEVSPNAPSVQNGKESASRASKVTPQTHFDWVYSVGLTGGIASGKSTIANLFAQLGVNIIDADVIAHQLVLPGTEAYRKIIEYFGLSVLQSGATDRLNLASSTEAKPLDRRKIAALIFEDSEKKAWLEHLLHPLIWQQMQAEALVAQSAYVMMVVPLLIEANSVKQVSRVLVVDTPYETQLERLLARDKISLVLAKQILHAQLTNAQRLRFADDIMTNDDTVLLQELESQVRLLHEKYLSLAGR